MSKKFRQKIYGENEIIIKQMRRKLLITAICGVTIGFIIGQIIIGWLK